MEREEERERERELSGNFLKLMGYIFLFWIVLVLSLNCFFLGDVRIGLWDGFF